MGQGVSSVEITSVKNGRTVRRVVDLHQEKSMDNKKQKKPPEQARREENTQQLTELKYLKAQLATKDAKIKALETTVAEVRAGIGPQILGLYGPEAPLGTIIEQTVVGLSEMVKMLRGTQDPILAQIKSDAEGQRPGKFQP